MPAQQSGESEYALLKLPAPIPPKQLKRVLELRGYVVSMEDEWNWSLVNGDSLPIVVPKDGGL